MSASIQTTAPRQSSSWFGTGRLGRLCAIGAVFIAVVATRTAAGEYGPAALARATLYRLIASDDLQRSADGGATWQDVTGLPVRVLPEDRSGEPLPVTAVAVDSADPRRLLVAVGPRVFYSTSSGADWTEIPLGDVVNRSTYVTAAAIDPNAAGRWMLGTSYDGLYVTEDAGRTWTDVTADWTIDPLYLGAGFYEEISGLQIDATGRVVAAVGMGGGFVRLDLERRVAVRLRPVTAGETAYQAPAQPVQLGAGAVNPAADPARERRRTAASGRTGIYLAAANATREKLGGYFALMSRHPFNSLVVDLKDDYGRVTYDTTLELPRRVGAVDAMVDLPALVRMAHERGVSVIARIVVFKDRRLYAYDNYRYALWDSAADRPWGVYRSVTDEESGESRVVQVEHWVDPFAPQVWDYNLAIAEEAVTLGVDEIQFDYVRFPSDGATETMVSRYAPAGAGHVEALEAFLSRARSRLEVPISIDVFGFNAWSRMSYLGQDISRLAAYVDAVCPMFYPSHFATSFLPHLSYLERARVIYDEGTRRARAITSGSVIIRPYIQAFLLGPELDYGEEEYRRYLDLQREGAAAGQADGYTLWNASGRYYMLP